MHCYKNFFNVLVNVNVPSNELHNAFFFFYIHFYFQCKHISLLTLCCPIDIFKVTTQIYKYTPSHGLRTVQWTFWVFPPTPGFLLEAWDFCRGGLSSAAESLWWWTIGREELGNQGVLPSLLNSKTQSVAALNSYHLIRLNTLRNDLHLWITFEIKDWSTRIY